VLLSGQPGLGKTSVARLLARECGSGLVEVLAGNIADPSQLLSLLSRLPRAGFILVDEIHNLAKACEEFLYGALEDRVVEAVLREGGRTRAVKIRLEPFTLVGATTRLGDLSEPFRSRFRESSQMHLMRHDQAKPFESPIPSIHSRAASTS
jgi:Holliday junction DNA helicase RuvB